MKVIRFSPHAEANLVAREIARADTEAAIRQLRPPRASPPATRDCHPRLF